MPRLAPVTSATLFDRRMGILYFSQALAGSQSTLAKRRGDGSRFFSRRGGLGVGIAVGGFFGDGLRFGLFCRSGFFRRLNAFRALCLLGLCGFCFAFRGGFRGWNDEERLVSVRFFYGGYRRFVGFDSYCFIAEERIGDSCFFEN